jgi:hypothetical protein
MESDKILKIHLKFEIISPLVEKGDTHQLVKYIYSTLTCIIALHSAGPERLENLRI